MKPLSVLVFAKETKYNDYKDEGIDGLKEKQRSGRPSKARNQNHAKLLQSIIVLLVKKMIIIHYL
jgi:transposase